MSTDDMTPGPTRGHKQLKMDGFEVTSPCVFVGGLRRLSAFFGERSSSVAM